jgi:acyl-CoA reductase-like NAD-dependent aldehyde dehydrogenase
MGRPISQTKNEVASTLDRARHMVSIAKEALKDSPAPDKDGFTRFMRKEALGVVTVISPWVGLPSIYFLPSYTS